MNALAISAAAILLLTTAACDSDRIPTAPKPSAQTPDSIISVSVTIPSIRGLSANTIGVGREAFPVATAMRADGTTVNVTQPAMWQSSDVSIVKIERERFPVGVAVGNALVSATYQGVTGSQLVTTRKCISWELSRPTMMWLDQSVEFIASAYDACLIHWSQVNPAWSTSNAIVAALEASNGWPPRIKVVGRSPGTAVITARVTGDSVEPLERTASITVLSARRPPPQFLWFNINDPLHVGDTGQLEAESQWVSPIEWKEDATGGYWKSSDRSVVAITPRGEFIARNVGSVTISVEFEGARRDITTRVVRP